MPHPSPTKMGKMWAMQQIMFKGLDRRLAEFLLAEEDGLVELKRGAITLRDTDGLNHLK